MQKNFINPISNYYHRNNNLLHIFSYAFDIFKSFLFEVALNDSFIYQENKVFIKLHKRRKRYICKNVSNGRKFLFSPVARVKIKIK